MVVLKVVAAATTRTLSQFDQCAVAILADIVFPVKVAAIAPLERAGGMQHRWGRARDCCSNLHRSRNCQDCMIDFDARRFVKVVA